MKWRHKIARSTMALSEDTQNEFPESLQNFAYWTGFCGVYCGSFEHITLGNIIQMIVCKASVTSLKKKEYDVIQRQYIKIANHDLHQLWFNLIGQRLIIHTFYFGTIWMLFSYNTRGWKTNKRCRKIFWNISFSLCRQQRITGL